MLLFQVKQNERSIFLLWSHHLDFQNLFPSFISKCDANIGTPLCVEVVRINYESVSMKIIREKVMFFLKY